MGAGAKEKGSEYERGICTRLSLWVSDHLRKDVFWRSAMSGGRATVASHRRDGSKFDSQSGDISAIHKLGHILIDHFVIDTKFYKDLQAHLMVFGGEGEVLRFWRKIREEADDAGKWPMLILKQNRQHELVGLCHQGAAWLEQGVEQKRCMPPFSDTLFKPTPGSFTPVCLFPRADLNVFLLRDMLCDVNFKRIRKIEKAKGLHRVKVK